ncbi:MULTISPECIES: hypothetical protein [Arthrobacter]|nr:MULTISPECIES: hypothetical protein [Arthrobacter]
MNVIVIVAGLAGLRDAGLAAEQGHDVTIREASAKGWWPRRHGAD